MNKICFVILSHSSYTDIWPLLLKSYKNNIINAITDVDFFITSDSMLTEDDFFLLKNNGFSHLIYSKNISWSDALVEVVNKNELNYYAQILFSFDDLIIKDFSLVKFKNALSEMVLNRDKYLKIYNSSHVNLWAKILNLIKKQTLFEINKFDSYRGNLVFSCWDIKFMKKVLNNKGLNNLSPWQFEQKVNLFIDNSIGYKCVYSNVLEYENVIIKGKLHKQAFLKSKKSTQCDFVTKRDYMTRRETLIYTLKLYVFKSIRQIVPHRLFYFLRRLKINLLR